MSYEETAVVLVEVEGSRGCVFDSDEGFVAFGLDGGDLDDLEGSSDRCCDYSCVIGHCGIETRG